VDDWPDYGKRRFGLKDVIPPPGVFVRVANKRLMLDAAVKGVNERCKVTSWRVGGLELNGERFGGLNAETQSSETGADLERGAGRGERVRLAATMKNYSTIVTNYQ
jgi:hypothetical protein